jgi:sulfatase maturation enzyme AslB (radical SAM superfamily)
MANQTVFCNVPWTNLHIYWDGSFGACCSERHAPHSDSVKYNIKNMSVSDWYSEIPMQTMRTQIKSDTMLSQCEGCYKEETIGYESRRIKENFKSVIFTKQAFNKSYAQSPMHRAFESTTIDRLPIDWHVDLGNECNLACKMCNPRASSKISSIFNKWKILEETANRNWTQDPVAWQNFLDSIMLVPNLNRLHFMGGEPLLNKKFLELLDFLLENKRQAISISFVTNGTVMNQLVVDKLKQFSSCDIEISLESISNNNHYIRQASNTATILKTISELSAQQTDTFHVVLRSVPQLLNINNYDQYISWAWNLKLPIQGIPLIRPDYLQIAVLPFDLRQTFIKRYENAKNAIPQNAVIGLSTGRNVGALDTLLRRECDAMIAMLSDPEPTNVLELRKELAEWLMRWDKEFGLDARNYYPEYAEFLNDIQYRV